MYTAIVAGRSANVSSYEAAKSAAKDALTVAANNIRSNPRLFRSPKVRTRVAAAVERVTFPKKAGNVAVTVAGVIPVRIKKSS